MTMPHPADTRKTPDPLTSRFGAVYVISLEERTDRRSETRSALLAVGQNPDAVNWFIAKKPAEKGVFPSRGVRGAFESHCSVLKQARDAGARSVLVLEDDIDFPGGLDASLRRLDRTGDWDIVYGGHYFLDGRGPGHAANGYRRAAPAEEFIGLHCYAVSGRILGGLIAGLESFPAGTPGDPLGGPMPVDGAINVLRNRNPSWTCLVAEPPFGNQRSSRTDIGDVKWFDRVALIRAPVAAARLLKNYVRRRKRAR
jgi:hypothetical protein